jgi:tetratricopeptide (TPR) repeat protein
MQPVNLQAGQPAGKAPARLVVCVCLFLMLAVLAVFGQTTRFGFVDYDDPQYVYANPVVEQGLTWNGALWALSYGKIGHWHPLTWLSHMADWQVFGLWAGGHHLTNVVLHGLTTILLFLVLRKMTGALWRSAFVAAVFAVHPLRAESVAWISERKDVLSGMFFMLTLWAYVDYARQPSRRRFAAVALLYGLGLLSKNMLVTLPFVLLLLDWWPLARMKPGETEGGCADSPGSRVPFWGLVKEKIPLLLLSVGSCIVTVLVPEKFASFGHVPVLERLGNALLCYVIYLQQMVFPDGLAIPYLFPPHGLPIWKAGLALVVLAGITASVVAFRPRCPYLLMGWLWYLGMLVPVIGLVQISYYSHADRYTYLPGIGLAMAGTWAVADWSLRWRYRRAVLVGLMVAVIGALTALGHVQTSYWRNDRSLWSHALDCTSDNYVARFNYGNALMAEGNREEAIALFRKALEIKPDYGDARLNLGNALIAEGNREEAVAQFHKALEINPDYAEARFNLGAALFMKGDIEGAIAQFRKTLEINPDYAEARFNLGAALFMKGDIEGAIAQFRKTLEINPDYAEARKNLGNALFASGDLDGAVAQFRKTLDLQPNDAQTHYNLGNVLFQQGELLEAIAQYQNAVEIKPDFGEARNNLGAALFSNGDLEGAIAQFRKVVAMQPALTGACDSLGRALLRKGDFDGAMACFEKTTPVNPDPSARWCNLGNDLLQEKDLEGAIICYRQAIKITPRSADIYARLGGAFFLKGETKEAMEAWQQALEINPNEANVQNNLAWSLATTPDTSLRNGAKAVALATQASQSSGGANPMILHTLAAAYAEVGNFGLAAVTARRAIDLAVAQKNDLLAANLRKEIQLYDSNTPLRILPQ